MNDKMMANRTIGPYPPRVTREQDERTSNHMRMSNPNVNDLSLIK